MISYHKFVGYEGSAYRDGFAVLKNGKLLEEIILKYVWSPIVWKDGIRKSENFLYADFLVLDIDEPTEPLEQTVKRFCDHKIIIATTKSHQKEKNGIICDRFRMIIPFDQRITDVVQYKYNMEFILEQCEFADKACKDAARLFFPCQKIVYVNKDKNAYLCNVQKYIPTIEVKTKNPENKVIPQWALNFINNGDLGRSNSRHVMILGVAYELYALGFEESSVRSLIQRAPINWQGVDIVAVMQSARNKFLKGGG